VAVKERQVGDLRNVIATAEATLEDQMPAFVQFYQLEGDNYAAQFTQLSQISIE
jgi:uncharacterized Fe-S radical SAM superfamily protein PflX